MEDKMFRSPVLSRRKTAVIDNFLGPFSDHSNQSLRLYRAFMPCFMYEGQQDKEVQCTKPTVGTKLEN